MLAFRNTPDYDQPADSNQDNVYMVNVQVSDGRYYGSLEVMVTVTDRDEAEPVVTGSATLSFGENTPVTTRLYSYRVTDADRGTMFAWSVRGTGSDDFTITNAGELYFSSPPNHERPADANSDNVYAITVVASDGLYEGVLDVTVTVTEVNEGPEISGRDTLTVSENYDAVLATYFGVDPEDTTAEITRWSTSGRDGGDFTINSDGELSFRNPPDHGQPVDYDQDNVYEVTVRASDGRVYGNYDVVVTVEPVDEAPEFRTGSQTTFSYREDGTAALYTYHATDPEGGHFTWDLSGPNSDAFEISEDGVLKFRNAPDYEAPLDLGRDNVYEVTVESRDANGNTARLEVTVTVVNLTD